MNDQNMLQNRNNDGTATISSGQPDLADGLRRLYDSILAEPLPDGFKDLLARLDNDIV